MVLESLQHSGEIKIFWLDNKKCEKKLKEDIGVVLDDSFLSDYLNPKDINRIMKNVYKNWDEKLFFKYMEDFKLPINKLSKDYIPAWISILCSLFGFFFSRVSFSV